MYSRKKRSSSGRPGNVNEAGSMTWFGAPDWVMSTSKAARNVLISLGVSHELMDRMESISTNGTCAPPVRSSAARERRSCPSLTSLTGRHASNAGKKIALLTSAFGNASRRRRTALLSHDASEDVGKPITFDQSRTATGCSLFPNSRERYDCPLNSTDWKPARPGSKSFSTPRANRDALRKIRNTKSSL